MKNKIEKKIFKLFDFEKIKKENTEKSIVSILLEKLKNHDLKYLKVII